MPFQHSNIPAAYLIKTNLSVKTEDTEDKHEFQVNLHENENIEVIPETPIYPQYPQKNDNGPEQIGVSYMDTGSCVGFWLV